MKKTAIILLFILFCNPKSFGQTVSINSLVVNNVSVNSTDPINIHPSAITTISLSTQVLFTIPQGNNGTIDVYYRKNNNSPVVTASGGSGGFLQFNGGNSATRSFVITLNPAQFDPTGGYIYSEYKTSTGTTYKSVNIPIVKIIPDINIPPSDPNNASQTVPYGGIPLLPSFVNYYNISSQDWVDNANNIVLSDRNGWLLYNTVTIRQRTIFIDGRIQYEPQKMNITVSKFLPNLSRLFVNNVISNNMYVPIGQNPQAIIGNQASESHSTASGTVTNTLSNYQWQSRVIYPFWWGNFSEGLALYGWQDIPGATQTNYTPSSPIRGMEYRRLVLESPNNTSIYRNCAASNIITVYPVDNKNIGNTICCDQNVLYNANANPIIGSSLPGAVIYKWQSSFDGIDWQYCSTGKDYTPVKFTSGRRPYVGNIKYRRLVLDYSTNLYYLSNEINIFYSSLSSKISNKKDEKTDLANNSSMTIYPNPSASIITVDGIDNISTFKVKVIDLTGKTVIYKESNHSKSELLQLDISMLPNGIYTLELENEYNKFTKKIVKN
jgi:hypothetical protein